MPQRKPTVSQLAWAIKKANDAVQRVEPKYDRAVQTLEFFMAQFRDLYPLEFQAMQNQDKWKNQISSEINQAVDEKNAKAAK